MALPSSSIIISNVVDAALFTPPTRIDIDYQCYHQSCLEAKRFCGSAHWIRVHTCCCRARALNLSSTGRGNTGRARSGRSTADMSTIHLHLLTTTYLILARQRSYKCIVVVMLVDNTTWWYWGTSTQELENVVWRFSVTGRDERGENYCMIG